MRGLHTIELQDKSKIHLLFNTMTLATFCERNGNITLAKFYEQIDGGFTLKEYFSLLLCGAEEYCSDKNLTCDYSKKNASAWIDDMGGIASEGFVNILHTIRKSVLNSDEQKNGQKKTVPVKS